MTLYHFFVLVLSGFLLSSGRILYHGTSLENCHLIHRDGFIPSLKSGTRHTHHGEGIYFTPDRMHALGFARRSAQTAADLCIISFDFSEVAGAIFARPSSDTFNFDAPIDFSKSKGGKEYIFKRQGIDKLATGSSVSFEQVDKSGRRMANPEYGSLKINSKLFSDWDGRAHVRTSSTWLSKGEERLLRDRVASHWSSLELVQDPTFHMFNAVTGAIRASLGCDALNSDCAADVLEAAIVDMSRGVGAVAGGAIGGVAGAVGAGYATSALMVATGIVNPFLVPGAIALGGWGGQLVGQSIGAELASSLAQWVSEQTLRRFMGFLQELVGWDGKHAAARELELSWSSRSSCTKIKEQRRRLMQKHHPDRCRSEFCKEKSLRINAAFDKLSQTCFNDSGHQERGQYRWYDEL